MSIPITSKLAIIAQCMDNFLRDENNALSEANRVLRNDLVTSSQNILYLTSHLRRSVARIREVEAELRYASDQNERLQERLYSYEVSRLLSDEALAPSPPVSPPFRVVRRRLTYESSDEETVIDLTED